MIKNIDVEAIIETQEFLVSKSSNPFRRYLGYYLNDVLVGYLIYDVLYEKMDVVDVFVKSEYRNKKIATNMLKELINIGNLECCENITLEVRVSNIYAIKLYEKMGFKKGGIRKGYYNGEDGILMELVL